MSGLRQAKQVIRSLVRSSKTPSDLRRKFIDSNISKGVNNKVASSKGKAPIVSADKAHAKILFEVAQKQALANAKKKGVTLSRLALAQETHDIMERISGRIKVAKK
jgi:hypothetical protein